MEWTSAPNTVVAPLLPAHRRFLPAGIVHLGESVERALEVERAQLPLWFVVAFATGIGLCFALPGPPQWIAAAVFALAVAAAGLTLPGTRSGRALMLGGVAMAVGLALIWWRAERVAAPVLSRPLVSVVEKVEVRPAKEDVRVTLATRSAGLPPRVRVTLADSKKVDGIGVGATLRLRARLQPPPPMALPGTHDFARDLWFQQIGAVGRALDPPTVLKAAGNSGLDALRDRLGHHIRSRLPGGAGGIATALATGDQGAISDEDADAMRRSGLAHLLSVSGLHIAAVVGAAMLLSLRLLALSERLALRFNLVLVSAGLGAAAGIGYTLLTGLQVPTVRSCIASLLVLGGIALGREAISLRLVAVGALVVLLLVPQALVGASFQLSFAAVTAIIAFHGLEPVRRRLGPREEGLVGRGLRSLAGLVATGLVVEFALMPFALYHFHKAGLYGVAANLVAIPLTTFVVMPLEALALALDPIGLGGPFWTLCGWALDFLLTVAHAVGGAKGAVTVLPTMPVTAFALFLIGGAWICLWTRKHRWWGAVPIVIAALLASTAQTPDLLVTGDGQHVAVVRADGVQVLLRTRSGDFVRDLISEVSAFDGDPLALEDQHFARCSRDSCVADVVGNGGTWRVLALRSRDRIAWESLTGACRDADIVVADRRLPRACLPRWLKLDRPALEDSGGVSIRLGKRPDVHRVTDQMADHPWARPPVQ